MSENNVSLLLYELKDKHGVSVQEVKRDMQEAVDKAYENPTFYARCVHRKAEKPTVDEFVEHITRRLKTESE